MDTNLQYVIFDYSEVNKINFDEVLETSINSLRVNFDMSKTFVKWIGEEPECVKSLTTKSTIYNHSEMLEVLTQPEWNFYIPTSGSTE